MSIAKPHATFRCRLPRSHPQGSRECLLFRVYRNMRGRARGSCTRTPWIYPPGFPWKSYAEFRTWALMSGFSKATPSPDRPNPREAYSATNVVWRTKSENFGSSRGKGYYGAQPDGPEPPQEYDDCAPGWSAREAAKLPPLVEGAPLEPVGDAVPF